MKKILIGGSPCTYWSISQKPDTRETVAEGLGWELFENYLIALKKFKPDYFLYENNESISKEIQKEIEKSLEVELLHLDSALVSAQKRRRIYGTNITGIQHPEDRGLKVKDILVPGFKRENLIDEVRFNGKDDTTDNNRIVRIGTIGNGGQGERVYSINGKSCTLSANGGGRGAKTGLYLVDGQVRKLNVIEAERLQTLPDNYTKAIKEGQLQERRRHSIIMRSIYRAERESKRAARRRRRTRLRWLYFRLWLRIRGKKKGAKIWQRQL